MNIDGWKAIDKWMDGWICLAFLSLMLYCIFYQTTSKQKDLDSDELSPQLPEEIQNHILQNMWKSKQHSKRHNVNQLIRLICDLRVQEARKIDLF